MLSVMLIFSAVLAVCLLVSELHRIRETEEENQKYMAEHSLFEDIVIGGNQLERDTDSDHHPVPGREEPEEEQVLEVSRARQETESGKYIFRVILRIRRIYISGISMSWRCHRKKGKRTGMSSGRHATEHLAQRAQERLADRI